MLIYVHGFNSSALSFKAGLVAQRMTQLGRDAEFACPDLDHRPKRAIAQLEALISAAGKSPVALIGSSLGGYYATNLCEKHRVRAALVNPAIRPYELLRGYIGVQHNLHTGAEYEFTDEHLAELRQLEVARITPGRYLLVVTTGDEVLDYRAAVEKYRGCEQVLVDGGDHGFGNFADYLDIVLRFCGVAR
jgi:uncharacterized protein